MTDRREAILAQLLAIARAVPGVNLAARNKLSPNDTDLPAIIIYDGDEVSSDADPDGTRPANAPRRITMQPAIEIAFGDHPEDIGTSINVMRAALIKAICTDTTLIGLALDRNGIRYLGCVSGGAGLGRSQEATMLLNFAFTYALRPDEL